MTRKVTVAAVHANGVFMDKDASVNKAIAFIEEAGTRGIDYLVFPEAFIPGYPYWGSLYPTAAQVEVNIEFTDASVELEGPELARIADAARRAEVGLALGRVDQEVSLPAG